MSQFFLMHKNDLCGSLIINDDTGSIEGFKNHNNGISPFLGNCDLRRMKKWWNGRAVPASRKMIKDIIKQKGYENSEIYLAKNLALSMTDAYWICPINADLRYEDVKLTTLDRYNKGKIPYHNDSSYDPNASLGGQMEKYWDLNAEVPILVKESYKYYGQQAINELFASKIHYFQNNIPYVNYEIEKTEDNGLLTKCEAFTNDDVELISAYEIIEGAKLRNDISLYENYIQICVELGLDEGVIRDFMDYQTLTDFIISNTDEHLHNFGLLRDSNTYKYIGPAPIFDSGNSMFFSEKDINYTRVDLLERKITAFFDSEEKMLKNIKNRNVVDLSLLPSEVEVSNLYVKYGVPEVRAKAIARNYKIKIDMVQDFQRGATISLYNEKQIKN